MCKGDRLGGLNARYLNVAIPLDTCYVKILHRLTTSTINLGRRACNHEFAPTSIIPKVMPATLPRRSVRAGARVDLPTPQRHQRYHRQLPSQAFSAVAPGHKTVGRGVTQEPGVLRHRVVCRASILSRS